jgi:tetratricopeptide (TPR) repeat protein/4-amino-4-deoxy-L-arabinose transferase-like glycosyltransferase
MLLPASVVFAIAFGIRLVHVLQIRSTPFFSILMGDSRGYDEWAQRIAGGEWWGREVFYQAPLYPYFLGAIYAIAGRYLLLVRLVQALIGSASCVFVALAASRLVSRRAGIVAGAGLALYAPAIFFDGLLQKSVLDVFFVSLALWFIAQIQPVRLKADATHEKKSVRGVRLQPDLPWLWLGLTIGALSLTRENALVFTVVIVAWALTRSWRHATWFVAGVAIVLVPVAARNSLVGGGFYVTTAQFGPNFYIGNNPKAEGTYASLRYGRGAPEYERQDATELAELTVGHQLTPAEVSSYWTGRALQFITSQPGAWLVLMARKAALLVNRSEMVDTEDQASYAEWSWPLWLLGPIAHFGVLVPLAVLGVFATWPERAPNQASRRPWPLRSRLWVLYALILAYAASVVLFYVFARYRYPLVPMLVIVAAAGLVEAESWVRTARPEPVDQPSCFALRRSAEALAKAEGRARGSTSPVLSELALRRAQGERVEASPPAIWCLATVAVAAVVANWPLLSTNHMRAVTENNLGAAEQADRRFDEADAHYRRSIAFRSDYAPAYSNLGAALRARRRNAESIAVYEQALRLQPDYADAHYNLGNALMDEGRFAEAIEHFQIALRSVPGSEEVHNNFGIALASAGRHDEALAEFSAAVRIKPTSAKAQHNLADALLRAGRGSEAIDRFRRATELAPEDGSFHYDYGSVLLEAGRPQDAVTEFRAALKSIPQSPEVHNNLGIALGTLGKLDEAIAEFQQALRAKPDFTDARTNLRMAAEARSRQR